MRAGAVLTALATALLLVGCKAAPAPEKAAAAEEAECVPVPKVELAGRVTDAADILALADESRLEARLAAYEQETRHQMVVLTAASLAGQPIDTFATCTANRWGIGRKDTDDGILILVAPAERQVRIATGLGMEKTLTDAKAAAVIDKMTPHFKAGDYAEGIDTAVAAIAAETGGKQ